MLDEQLIAQVTSELALLKPAHTAAHTASLGGMEPWRSLTIYWWAKQLWLGENARIACFPPGSKTAVLWGSVPVHEVPSALTSGLPQCVSFYPSFFHQLFCTLLKTSSTEGLSWGLELTGMTFVWHGAALVCPRTSQDTGQWPTVGSHLQFFLL